MYGGLTADPDYALGHPDFIGMAFALAGTLGQVKPLAECLQQCLSNMLVLRLLIHTLAFWQAVFVVWVQKTRLYIAIDTVLYVNYASMLSFAPAISFAAEPQVGSIIITNASASLLVTLHHLLPWL